LYNRYFAFAFISQVGFVLANTALMAHYARWIGFLGGRVDTAGWITGTASIAGLLLRPWIGQWIDRWGAKTVWLLGYAIFIAGSLSNLWLHDLGLGVYVCRALIVVGGAFVFSSSITYVSHLAPPERRAEAIGMLGVAGFIGILFGPFWAELTLSAERTRGEFEMIFVISACLLSLPLLLLLLLKKPESEARRRSTGLGEFLQTARKYWPGSIFFVQSTFGLCMTIPFVFLTKFIDDAGLEGNGFSLASVFFMCYAGWGLTLRLILRRAPERFGRRKLLLAGAVVMALGMLSFLLVDAEHASRIVIPALLCGTGHSLMYHTCTALLLESFPDEMRGVGSALSMVAMDLGMIGGSQVLGEVAFRFGYNTLFVIVALINLTAGIVYALVSIPVWQGRARQRQAERVGPLKQPAPSAD
jgi:MFS family permease